MNKSEINVSIIITVYNSETTLKRCIDSALKQTIKGLEIVIVDDGSNDKSVNIIKEYALRHKNINFIINSQNKGAGYAKNVGVRAAKGEYVTFLDSDDYIESDYLEQLYRTLKTTESDVALADISVESITGTNLCRISDGNIVLKHKGLAKLPVDYPSIVSGNIVAGFWGAASACTKLAKRSLWLEYKFAEGRRCDDLPAVLPILAASKQIVYVPQCHYHYNVQTENSVERNKSINKSLDAIEAIRTTLLFYTNNSTVDDFAKILVATSLVYVLDDMLKSEDILNNTDYIKRVYFALNDVLNSDWLDIQKNIYLAEIIGCDKSSEKQMVLKVLNLLISDNVNDFVTKIQNWKKRELKNCPKVSIVIPVYNGSNYMKEAIDSALNQTYKNIEIIVVNDGSNDGGATERIARSYGNKIHYYVKPNGGVATALNFGIERMTGEYFSWLSHDDMYAPNKIQEEIQYLMMQDDPTVIIAEGYKVVNSKGEYLYTVNLHDQYPLEKIKKSMFLVMRGGINGCALLIHKSHFSRIGMFNPNLPTTQDYDLWFRMFRNQKVYYAASSNVLSRSHNEQGSKALSDEHIKECDKLWIGMANALTEEEKIYISGSEIKFYQELWDFLRTVTGYVGATLYVQQKLTLIALAEYKKTWKNQFLNIAANCCGVDSNYMKNKILPLVESKTDKPRIVFQFFERNAIGGLNRIVVENANMLSEIYDVIIWTWGSAYINGYKSCDKVLEMASNHSHLSFYNFINLMCLLKVDAYIFSHCCIGGLLPILEYMTRVGIKTIAWNHEDYFLPFWRESLQGCLKDREKYLPKADAVVWVNSSSQAIYGLNHSNSICIPNQAGYLKAGQYISKKNNILVAVGRYDDSIKNLGDLLRVFAYVRKQLPDTELYIVGSVDLRLPVPDLQGISCEEFIKNEGFTEENLHLVGWTEDVNKYYKMASLHIMPSLYEGFGLVVLEAAVNGTPTVAYGGSGMQDIITNGYDGIITDCGDWECMAKEIVKLLNNREMLNNMQNHLSGMLQKYSKENILKKWKELLDVLLQKNDEGVAAFFADKRTGDLINIARRLLEEHKKIALGSAISYDEVWHQECLNMQKSLSWRITKPLRLSKKVVKSLRENGLKVTLSKIKYKLQTK